jgi:Thioredoxin like C-terminal domain
MGVTLVPFLIALAVLLVVGAAPFVGAFALLVSLGVLLLWGLWKAGATVLSLRGENVFRLAETSELFGRGGADDPDFMLVPRQRRLAEGNGGSTGPVRASPDGAARHERRAYELPARLPLNHWAIAGEWTIGREKVVLDQAGGSIAFRFHARDAHLVLASGAENPIPFRVFLDGEAPGASHGVDVDADGNGLLREGRLYQLVREHDTVRERTLEITFLEPGVEAYAFTFG